MILTPRAEAYETYRNGGTNCSQCHPGLVGGSSGPEYPAHTVYALDCAACHQTPGSTPVETGNSGLGFGCAGYHQGDGLQLQHTNAGVPGSEY